MARIKHSMTKDDYEKATSGKGAVLKPGVYRARLIKFTDAQPEGKNPRWEVVYEITHGDGKGTRLYDYLTHGDNAKFKKDQFFTALGLVTLVGGKVKVAEFDPDRLNKYPEVLARVTNETYEDAQRHKLASVLPLDADEDDDDAESDEDEDAESEDEDEDEEGDEGEDEEPDFDAMSISELREWAEENEIEIPAKVKGVSKVRAFLVDKWEEMAVPAEDDEDEEDDEPEDEDEDGEEETEEVDLTTMKLGELRRLADDNEIDHEGVSKKDLIVALTEALSESEDDEEDEEDEVDYTTWSLTDLKNELKERGIRPLGSKAQLVGKLKKSDESDPV